MWVKRILIFGIWIAALLSGCGPETSSLGDLAQAEATPTREAASPTPEPTFISPLPTPTPSLEPTTVVSLPTATPLPEPTAVYTEPIPALDYTPTPIPTPDVNAVTVPELDGIAFMNARRLPLPMEAIGAFGKITWSPDGQHYVGVLSGSERLSAGDNKRRIRNVYMGDANTGELELWQHNASWPAWSRDGRSVYYLALRTDGDRFYYDLYKRSIGSPESDLIIQDVGLPRGPQPCVAETTDGQLVLLDRENQPAVLLQNGKNLEMASLASMVGKNNIANPATAFSLSPDGHTIAVIPLQEPMYLVDLTTPAVIAEFDDTAMIYDNIAWSADGIRLAYATGSAVRIYDLINDEMRTLVSPRDMGFPDPSTRSGFAHPRWSPDGQVVFFLASTPDWLSIGVESFDEFLFAATQDGTHRKAISRYFFDDMSPDGTRAIVTALDAETQRETKYLVDIVWGDGR